VAVYVFKRFVLRKQAHQGRGRICVVGWESGMGRECRHDQTEALID